MPGETEPVLNPCGKCGSEAILREQLVMPWAGAGAMGSEHIAECCCCIQRGPWKDSRAEAINSWNDQNQIRTCVTERPN